MMTRTVLTHGLAVAAWLVTSTSPAAAQAAGAASDDKNAGASQRQEAGGADGTTRNDGFEGYDFGQVVEAMETSVNPLQREMNRSFRVFVDRVEEAERLLDEGRTQDAVQTAAAAIDGVLAVREQVLMPMWEGQIALAEQVAAVRVRLAHAVEAYARNGLIKLDQQTEAVLDAIARRIGKEQDPVRKKRLTAHYRTVRNLARIKAMAVQLSPDQRKMWMSVLQVVDEAAVAHQQVMMGTEVLFAQFEATAANLRAYVSLMETVDGASQLMQIVRGVDDHSAGMASFADSMSELQQRLATFNESVEQALQGRMFELEAQIDVIESPLGGTEGVIVTTAEDGELAGRIARVMGSETPQRR